MKNTRRALAVLAGTAALVLVPAAAAFAHQGAVTGVADCAAPGQWKITWTISNDPDAKFGPATIVSTNPVTDAAGKTLTAGGGTVTTVSTFPVTMPGTKLSVALTWPKDGHTGTAESIVVTVPAKCTTTAPPTTTPPPVTKSPTPKPTTTTVAPTATRTTVPPPLYANCAAVYRAGKAPLLRGQPGYRAGLDQDGDGVACEVATTSPTPSRTPVPVTLVPAANATLPNTGANTVPLVLTGGVLLVGGAGLMFGARRKGTRAS